MKKTIFSMTDARGFTLVEVLVAMVVLSIGIIALTSMQSTGIKGNATANILTTGGTWAADTVEQVFAMDYDTLADGNTTSVDGNYSINWDVTDDTPMPDTKTVAITVSSPDMGQQRNVVINYIKAKYVQ